MVDVDFAPWEEASSAACELRRLLRMPASTWVELLFPSRCSNDVDGTTLVEAKTLNLLLGEELAELVFFRLGSLCYEVIDANRRLKPSCWSKNDEEQWLTEGLRALHFLFEVRNRPGGGWEGDADVAALCELGFFSNAHVIASLHLAHMLCWQGHLDDAKRRADVFLEAVRSGPLREGGWNTTVV